MVQIQQKEFATLKGVILNLGHWIWDGQFTNEPQPLKGAILNVSH